MHELLAVCFWAIDRDSIPIPTPGGLDSPLGRDVMDDAMRTTLDRRYIEHDAYSLFAEIMKSAKPFYEWRAEELPVSILLMQSRHRLRGKRLINTAIGIYLSESSTCGDEVSTYPQ